jgi:hypothetical protein
MCANVVPDTDDTLITFLDLSDNAHTPTNMHPYVSVRAHFRTESWSLDKGSLLTPRTRLGDQLFQRCRLLDCLIREGRQ